MYLEQELEVIGLNKSEVKVYLYLLEHGISRPPQIAKGTGILRTNCYNVLSSLRAKGLVAIQKQDKKIAYLGRDPQVLLSILEERKETASRIVPELRALFTAQKNKPSIRFYEGFEEVKEIYIQTYAAKSKEVLAFGSTKQLHELQPNFLNTFFKEYKKRGIVLNDIITQSSEEKAVTQDKKVLGALYDFVSLPTSYGDVSTDMLLWDDNIALITLEEPIFGTVITSPPLAQTFRVIFQVLRATLKH